MKVSALWMLIPALLLVAPVDLDAQGRGRESNANDRNGNGPAFCRSGAGHPVHGWEWCREKGWDRADRDRGWWGRDDRRDDRDDRRRARARGGRL